MFENTQDHSLGGIVMQAWEHPSFWFMFVLASILGVWTIVCLKRRWFGYAGFCAGLAGIILAWAVDAPKYWHLLPAAIALWIVGSYFDDDRLTEPEMDAIEAKLSANDQDARGCYRRLAYLFLRLIAIAVALYFIFALLL